MESKNRYSQMNPGRLSLELPFKCLVSGERANTPELPYQFFQSIKCFYCFIYKIWYVNNVSLISVDFDLAEEPNNLQALSLVVNRALLHM